MIGASSFEAAATWPKSWLPFFCDAIGGAWKCWMFFLLSGRRMVANPSPTRPFSYEYSGELEGVRASSSQSGRKMANTHGSPSFVMPLEG